MSKHTSIMNRTTLVDEPIVEMILSKKYASSGISFMKDYNSSSTIYCVNGIKRNLIVKRNSSKYYSSHNFFISLNKNKLDVFNNATYVFIDEVADTLYLVDGIELLKYIIDHKDDIVPIEDSDLSYILIHKADISALTDGNQNQIIKYNRQFANLFEMFRDENNFANLI